VVKQLLSISFLFISLYGFTQTPLAETPAQQEVDSLYREDQFYIGLSFNFITERPSDIKNEGFSGGLYFGTLRDMPINKKRTLAIAAGLGYAYNYYGHNLFIGEDYNNQIQYIALNDEYNYRRNRFVTHEIEMPLEFRWRTSTPESYKFWRIYAGVKFGYVYYYSSKLIQGQGGDIILTDIPDFNRLRAGATLSFGHGTFNFQIYYGLNSFFNSDAKINGEDVGMNTIRLGLIFYIL
jgi:hypothetical protein